MKKEKEVKLTIYDQDSIGRGVAKLDNKIVFVEKALIDEICNVKIIREKKNYCESTVLSIDTKSKERRNYKCKYTDCGGCDLGHQKYKDQLKFKEKKIKTAFEKIGGISDIKINPIVPSIEQNNRIKI